MTNKWDEEFDFMQEEEGSAGKKDNLKKGKNKQATKDEFADLSDDDKPVKLPVINAKGRTQSLEKNKKNMGKVQLEEIPAKKQNKTRKNNSNPYDSGEDEQFQEEEVASYVSPPKQKSPSPKQKPPSPKQPPLSFKIQKILEQPKPEEQYAQQNFEAEDNYDQDFEPPQQKKEPSKPKEEKPARSKTSIDPIATLKPAKGRKGAQSVAQKVEVSARVQSRTSARSYDRSTHSKTRGQIKKQQLPNKYMSLAEKHCPDYDKQLLQEFGMDKLLRQNEKVREIIKKLNDELNDLINKNINQLKSKKTEKETNQDEIVKQLEEQKISNETALQNCLRDLSLLKSKEGALKEEEYQFNLDQRIVQTKNSINQNGKLITKLKVDVDSDGKRLTKIDKIDKEQTTVDITNVKIGIANTQKQVEKNEETLKKLEEKCQELTKKHNQMESKLNSQLQTAKDKGISAITNPDLLKKYQELKKKSDQLRAHCSATEGLFKTKVDMIAHQLEQIKGQIKQIQSSTLSYHANCEDVQGESKKTVEKAKRSSKISTELALTLDNILGQMEKGMTLSKESIDEKSTFSYPKTKKYNSQKNVEKTAVTPILKEAERVQDDSNLKKPQLFKKKKEEDKHEERIWKEQPSNMGRRSEDNREIANDANKQEEKQQKKEEEKKKPFSFRKAKEKTLSENAESPKEERKQPKAQEIKQISNEQAPNIAPRMIKFKKNKEETSREEPKKDVVNDKNTFSPPKQVINNDVKPEEQDQKPVFAPKRFNLRLKDKKAEEPAYTATIAEKKEEAKAQQTKPQEEEYKPKRISNERPEITVPSPAQNQLSRYSPEEEKPKLNLRLRDRQKQMNKLEMPEEKQSPGKDAPDQLPKIAINLNDDPKPSKENNNPYAQLQQAQKRQREGPLKKQKAPANVPKQQFNIYEQAQDLTNIKDITVEEPKPSVAARVQNQDLDLNQMLGIKKQKNQEFDQLLMDNKGKGNKKQAKKGTDFFGDLDL